MNPEPKNPGRDLPEPPRSGGETLLVVEESRSVRAAVKTVLEGQGYIVWEAEDGDTALEVARELEGPIHLLVTDLASPRIGGALLARDLAVIRPGIRVLFLSGFDESRDVPEGVRREHVKGLDKPFRPETLLRKVREVLAGGRP